MYDRILFPTDGRDPSDRAFERGVDLATTYDATLHVLYVIDASVFASDAETGSILERFEAVGREIVDGVSAEARAAGVDRVETDVVQGTPHRRILEYVDDHDVDLIVMGTHGRTGLDRYLLGSVTEKVVRFSEVPVLTVRQGSE